VWRLSSGSFMQPGLKPRPISNLQVR
jgi:hypothetical protein